MISGIQFVVLIFAVVMLFFSYSYYRRKKIDMIGFLVWGAAWVILFLAALFPQSISFFVQTLNVERGFDLFTILGFIFVVAVVFYLFVAIKKIQADIGKLANIYQVKYRKK